MITSMQAEEILGIVNSNHQNPHLVLGCHVVDVPLEAEVKKIPSIRTFLPDANKVFVVDKKTGEEYPMFKVHNDGLFEAFIWNKSDGFEYCFKAVGINGKEWSFDDPYGTFVEGLTAFDRYLFNRSQHYKIYEKMGAHLMTVDGKDGVYFSVWAPNAQRVSVVGDFNNWDGRKDPMDLLSDSGIWVLFIEGLKIGDIYKYEIKTKNGALLEKSDPYAICSEMRPKTASVIYSLDGYNWNDAEWIKKRAERDNKKMPASIYEVHLGSWKKREDGSFMSYRELADDLIPYVRELGFTHIELLPIEEHPFDGSWGYQVTGYFAPTSRFGEPKDLQYFIDKCHENNIGVILDWVPGHYPKDAHGLINFDGTALYEHEDPRKGEHMDWGTKIFNYGRLEVKNFLISNAMYWIDKFHFDGLRVDAVASMLYLDYSRREGEWIPNQFGGRENLEAIEFMKHLNSIMEQYYPGVYMIAEESTSFPSVSKPAYLGGLGFSFKWNMGWMHDTLSYIQKDPVYRKYHHGELTFSFVYAWSENFILPISHDEVVHGKGSMINKMPGDYWQKFANLRAYYTYMWTHPGKQLLFMGQEFGQFNEWDAEKALEWDLLGYDSHKGIQKCIADLNKVYRENPALWQKDCSTEGFYGINCGDSDNSVISFIRYGEEWGDFVIVAVNFTPVEKETYRLGVDENCYYEEIFNSDSQMYGGSNFGNAGGVWSFNEPSHGKPFSIDIKLPPLGAVIFKPKR